MNQNLRLLFAIAFFASVGVLPALAQSYAAHQTGESVDTSDSRVKTSAAGIRYISGGIGNASQSRMERQYDAYNLHVAMVSGQAYEEGSRITVLDADGQTLLEGPIDGSLVYMDVPAGHYTINALLDGTNLSRSVKITEGASERVVFDWEHVAR